MYLPIHQYSPVNIIASNGTDKKKMSDPKSKYYQCEYGPPKLSGEAK